MAGRLLGRAGSAGNCAAAGSYIGHGDHYRGFVASQRNGKWGRAIREPAAKG